MTTLHVERPNRETGRLEPVTLAPCGVCRPPIIDDDAPASEISACEEPETLHNWIDWLAVIEQPTA